MTRNRVTVFDLINNTVSRLRPARTERFTVGVGSHPGAGPTVYACLFVFPRKMKELGARLSASAASAPRKHDQARSWNISLPLAGALVRGLYGSRRLGCGQVLLQC